MYRLLLYGLLLVAVISVAGAGFKIINFSWYELLLSAGILVGSCYVFNSVFSRIYGADSHFESTVITALILFFIFSPPHTLSETLILVLVAALAMASKYVLAYRQRLIANPAAVAAVVISLLGLGSASWWVASPFMAAFVALLGLVTLRKIRRFTMVGSFFVISFAVILAKTAMSGPITPTSAKVIILSWPLLFMGTIMLTEPLTMPPRFRAQIIYACVVGFLFTSGLHAGRFSATPEVALVIGNIGAFFTSVRQRVQLCLQSKRELASGIWEFSFLPVRPFTFLAGQYADLVVPHKKIDNRGNRRMFTIASSPDEPSVLFGMKSGMPSSSFKTALMSMNNGDFIYSNHIAGDFSMPKNSQAKLLFVAGGIGVTPFRSMLQHIVDTQIQRDIVVLYVVSNPKEFVYTDVMQAAQQFGVKTVYILSVDFAHIPEGWQWETGHIRKDLLNRHVADLNDRTCYISGPDTMVKAVKKTLITVGVKRRAIKTDYFTGY